MDGVDNGKYRLETAKQTVDNDCEIVVCWRLNMSGWSRGSKTGIPLGCYPVDITHQIDCNEVVMLINTCQLRRVKHSAAQSLRHVKRFKVTNKPLENNTRHANRTLF